uniref:Uncharacterized protein n=1 Tax=Schistocephalus solidus TaxID=70667 RepID=A0A0V0J6F2_SCHSO
MHSNIVSNSMDNANVHDPSLLAERKCSLTAGFEPWTSFFNVGRSTDLTTSSHPGGQVAKIYSNGCNQVNLSKPPRTTFDKVLPGIAEALSITSTKSQTTHYAKTHLLSPTVLEPNTTKPNKPARADCDGCLNLATRVMRLEGSLEFYAEILAVLIKHNKTTPPDAAHAEDRSVVDKPGNHESSRAKRRCIRQQKVDAERPAKDQPKPSVLSRDRTWSTPCEQKGRQPLQEETSEEKENELDQRANGNLEENATSKRSIESFTDLDFETPAATLLQCDVTTAHARANRKQHIVIQGAPESMATVAGDKVEHDRGLVRQYAKSLLRGTESVKILKTFRIGKDQPPNGSSSRPRPLKVIWDTEAQAQLMLERKSSLRTVHAGVFFQPDYEPKERRKMRLLKNELNDRKNKGETGLQIKGGEIVHIERNFLWPEVVRRKT